MPKHISQIRDEIDHHTMDRPSWIKVTVDLNCDAIIIGDDRVACSITRKSIEENQYLRLAKWCVESLSNLPDDQIMKSMRQSAA